MGKLLSMTIRTNNVNKKKIKKKKNSKQKFCSIELKKLESITDPPTFTKPITEAVMANIKGYPLNKKTKQKKQLLY